MELSKKRGHQFKQKNRIACETPYLAIELYKRGTFLSVFISIFEKPKSYRPTSKTFFHPSFFFYAKGDVQWSSSEPCLVSTYSQCEMAQHTMPIVIHF